MSTCPEGFRTLIKSCYRDVEGWESGFEMLPHRVPSAGNSPLSGFVEGFLNGVFVDPAKIGPELLKVNGLSGDSMFVLSKVGHGRGMGECMVKSPLKLAKFIYPGVMCTAVGGILSPAGVGWVQSRTEGFHGDQ